MIELSVNVNKIALLRNSRGGDRPSVVAAARTVIEAGAYGITVHPRPDQRHVRPDDVRALATFLRAEHPGIEFNIEGNPFAPARKSERQGVSDYPGFMELVQEVRPQQCTLVPDADSQLTSDHGFDLKRDGDRVAPIVEALRALGIRVSLFMDPVPEQIEQAKAHGADRIELYTGPFAELFWAHGENDPATVASFETYADAARYATQIGLGVNAGHDLDLDNLPMFRRIEEVAEVSIGHALIADALEMGLAQTVKAYRNLMQ